MQNTKQVTKRKPICTKCRTPMKGHKRGRCRPNPWVDHGDNNKRHGGYYPWETKQWTGSKWEPFVVTAAAAAAVNKNEVIVDTGDSIETVPIAQALRAPPPDPCSPRDAFLSDIAASAESDTDSDMPELEPQYPMSWEEELDEFISTGTVIHMNHHLADNPPPSKEPKEPKEPEQPKEPKEPEESKEAEESITIEWKPLADEYWWNYYRNWQQNSTYVKFPTLMGMTGAQLGDIMENYGKYRNHYN